MPNIEITNVVIPGRYSNHGEYVEIENRGKTRYKLNGWRLEIFGTYGQPLLRFNLPSINGENSGFDPGERLFVCSSTNTSGPDWQGDGDKGCPLPHWDICTGHGPVLQNEERAVIRLVDGDKNTLDSYLIERRRGRGVAARSIFIGHGHAPYWKDLKNYLESQMDYDVETFESQPQAGKSITDVLRGFLNRSGVALLVLTKDDIHRDGSNHARENVIHELGLFQGRLGFEKAIAVLEEGVAEFSNMHGIQQIRFPSGNIKAVFGEIVAALKREVG